MGDPKALLTLKLSLKLFQWVTLKLAKALKLLLKLLFVGCDCLSL